MTQEELLAELTLARKRAAEAEALAERYSKELWGLKANAERCQHIVENANSIILVMDTKGNIVFLNQFGQRFFGYHENELLGQNVIGSIVSPKDLSGNDLTLMIQDIVRNPEQYSVNENENIRSNNERVRVLWTNKAIIDEYGRIKEILCIGNEVKKSQAK